MKSMTGYGQGSARNPSIQIDVEIRSVNHRFLDLVIRMPREIQSLEEALRRRIRSDIARGRVEVNVRVNRSTPANGEVLFDRHLARQYYKFLKEMSDSFGIADDSLLGILASMPGVFQLSELEQTLDEVEDLLMEASGAALHQLLSMRSREALQLETDLRQHLVICRQLWSEINHRAPLVVEEYRQRLRERVAALMRENFDGTSILPKERLETEILIFAEKSDINEELVRMKSHLDQLESLWKQEAPIGRTADFLLQEIHREVNTIASKSGDAIVAQKVVQVKTILEKMREQVQNIE